MKRSGEWLCARCSDSNPSEAGDCLGCGWGRDEDQRSAKKKDGFVSEGGAEDTDPAAKAGLLAPALPDNPDDWQEAEPAADVAGNPPWTCECGSVQLDEFMGCKACQSDRWRLQSFDGRGFFVTRTQLDHDLDCGGMRRLHWQQLLCPPSPAEELSALFVSGIVDSEEEAMEFAAQFFPPTVHAWMVAQDGMSPLRNDDSSVHVHLGGADKEAERPINGKAHGVRWWVQFFKPLTGLMHIKLYLFRFTNTLRVVVCSANPTMMSWSFQRENVWVQDFPVCRNARGEMVPGPKCEFSEYLVKVAEKMRMSVNCQKTFGLQLEGNPHETCVDFSGARGRLVASVPGEWSQRNCEREEFGHMRLRKCVREAGWAPENNRGSQIVCQSGSIGADFSHEAFFDDFMLSLGGACPFDCYDAYEHLSDGGDDDADDAEATNPVLGVEEGRYPANLRIFFPSRLMGVRNGRLYQQFEVKRKVDIHCTVNSWHSESYPTACFRDLQFPRLRDPDQASPFCHSKFIFRMAGPEQRERVEREGQCAAFVYVGSHNFSKTAWGFRREDVLKCNSFELGVVLSTRDFAEAEAWRAALPFDLEAPRYRPDDVPFTTHSQRMGSRYGDPSKSKSFLVRELVKLGFGEDEARNAVDAAHGNGALAFSMLTIARRLQ